MTEPQYTVHEALKNLVDSFGGTIAKDGEHFQGYKYNSIDGVTAAARPVFLGVGLTVCPSYDLLNVETIVRGQDKDGFSKLVFHATVKGTFKIVGPTGDFEILTCVGEALDTEGHATAQAISDCTKSFIMKVLQASGGQDNVGGTTSQRPANRPPQAAQLGAAAARAAGQPAPASADPGEEISERTIKRIAAKYKHALGWSWTRLDQEVVKVTGVQMGEAGYSALTEAQGQQVVQALARYEDAAKANEGPPPADEPPYDEEPF